MYSSGYTQVSKYSPQAQKKMQYRSKGKSCGYYMRIVFFFSSLIQSLIIVSLVLFLVYGKQQDSASTDRIQDLEESFSRLSIDNVALRQQRRNLTVLLNATLTEKTRIEWDLANLRYFANISSIIIEDIDKRLQQCHVDLMMCKNTARCSTLCTATMPMQGCNSAQFERLNAKLALVETNFTQMMQRNRMEMELIARDRDNINLEAIRLRREKSSIEKELQFSKLKCKEDFVLSLSGITNVSRAFLQKIESLFPAHIPFQLTCINQREHLEQIRTNCTSLSRDVEDKFQKYLNNVGEKVSDIQTENSHLKAENILLTADFRQCSQNRTGLIQEHKRNIEKLQLKNDREKEMLLLEKGKLIGDVEILENHVRYKEKEIEHLTENLRQVNMTCLLKSGSGGFGAGSALRPGQYGPFSSGGTGSTGLKPGSGGLGSNFGSTGLNKPGSTGLGTSSFGSTGASSGSGLNKFGSTGLGSASSGSGLNKFGSTGLGSASSGSGLNKFGSTGSGSASSGSGLNKFGSTGLGTSSFGSTGSNTGSGLNKQTSTGLGSSTFGSTGSSSGSGLNKFGSTGSSSASVLNKLGSTGLSSGSGLSKPGSTGLGSSSYGSTGSSSGSGLSKTGSTGLGSSSLGSTGSSSGSGLSKTGTTGLGSSSFGSTGSSSGSGLSKTGSTGLGSSFFGSTGSSSGSGLSKTGSTGLGSSSFGSTGSSSGSGLSKTGSTGLGSSSFGSTGSSSGSGLSKTGSTGLGSSSFGSTGSSSGSGLSKTGSTGLGSSSFGSTGSSTSLNKQATSGKTSSSTGSTGSTGSTSKTGSNGSGFSWFGFGSGNSKPGTGTGKGTSSGTSLGSGKTSGLISGPYSVAQHLQDLQRIINPSAQEERQDLSRMLG